MNEITAYLPGLSPVENKELCARFDGGRLSSDGGVLLLRGIEQRLGLAARLAGCLADTRDRSRATHSYADMIAARLFAIACGYEDCDDLDVLRFDPAFKLAERYDIAIMSTKGMSNTASRELIDKFCGDIPRCPLYVLHDFDKAGFSTPALK